MRITELPQAASVAQTDDLAIDVPGGRTYRVPRSILAPAPFQATIPTGYWSGSGSDYYFTVSASNVTANAQLYTFYDKASDDLLNGPVWAIPADGSFTIHTSAIPSGTVTISVLLAGIVGEAQYQVLADVYSRAQVDTIVSQSTANQVTQGTISNVKISDTVRTDSVPVGISLWQTQRATDSPMNGTVTTTIIVKPTSSGQYSSALLFGSGAVFVSSGLTSSGDFTWTRIQ